jgi:hypothetical protein
MDRENEETTYPLGDYIGAKEAAEMLKVTTNRVYEHIKGYRLPAKRFGKIYHIYRPDVINFRANPTGRQRTKPTPWRVFKGDVKVLVTRIEVKVREGQYGRLRAKLQDAYESQRHLFPGTMARYILSFDEQGKEIEIDLIWKSTDKAKEKDWQAYIDWFKKDLDDVLDWETASFREVPALLST